MNPAIVLTLARLVLAPLFACAFITGYADTPRAVWLWTAAGLALLIELTDFLDGRVARARNEVTRFGKLVDPMSDSLSRQTIFLSFLVCHIIPLWMFLVFLYRDAMMATLRIMIAVTGTVQAAKWSGKIKAGVQAAGTAGVLVVCLAQAHGGAWASRLWAGRHPGFWFILVAALITFVSAFDYFLPNTRLLSQMMQPDN